MKNCIMNAPRICLSVFILAVALVLSCSPIYYKPNTQNVPLHSKTGEGSAAVHIGDRFELQSSYSLSDETAVQVNAAFFSQSEEEHNDKDEGSLVELGVGYQRPIFDHLHFETYALAGVGRVVNVFENSGSIDPACSGTIEASVLRYGLQSSLGIKYSYLEFAASARYMQLKYDDIIGCLIFDNVDQIAYLQDANEHTLFEPAATLRVGLKKVKLQMQVGQSVNLTHDDFRQEDAYSTIGIIYQFD